MKGQMTKIKYVNRGRITKINAIISTNQLNSTTQNNDNQTIKFQINTFKKIGKKPD